MRITASSPPEALVIDVDLPPLRAQFCWSDAPPGPDLQVHLFRRQFHVTIVPKSRRILVTADSRYLLRLNGHRLGRGPLKGTLEHYHAETYELAPWLRVGANLLTVEVRWFGRTAPLGEVHSAQPGLLVQDLCSDELDTPGDWRTIPDFAVTPGWNDPFTRAVEFIGPLDRIDARKRDPRWTELDFDDHHWRQAITVGDPMSSNPWGLFPSHRLIPRKIPALIEDSRPFAGIHLDRRATTLPWILPANEGGELWLDAGALTTSYPELDFENGLGREVRLVYAEALGLWNDERTNWEKGSSRHDITRLDPHGYRDVLTLPGGRHQFEPFHWRTFWFIKVEILPGPEPVTLRTASHRFTTYPQTFSAQFSCADPDIAKLWTNSLRTLQLCAHETYEDCPYYEQMNYAGDSRLQALSSHYLANNADLGRHCLNLFRHSLTADGLTASRVPSRNRQIIPTFSLHWILMVGDHWQWLGHRDLDFVRSCLAPMDAVLLYFRDRITSSGFVGEIESWRWVDWVPSWPHGVPPALRDGAASTYLTALFSLTLKTAITLHTQAGHAADAVRWTHLRSALNRSLRESAWSEGDGLFREGPDRNHDPFTQHSQVMVLLADAATDDQIRRVGQRLVDDPSLVQLSLFHRFYLAKALATVDRFEAFFTHVLTPWREMIKNGLSTWLEHAAPTRSDCHAWSSWMTIVFLHDILGIRPAEPGWTAIRIEPQFRATTSATGECSTPAGLIHVAWHSAHDDSFTLKVSAPPGVPVTIGLPGTHDQTFAQGGEIQLLVGRPAT